MFLAAHVNINQALLCSLSSSQTSSSTYSEVVELIITFQSSEHPPNTHQCKGNAKHTLMLTCDMLSDLVNKC